MKRTNMLKYCICCVVYIKLVFGCWGAVPDDYNNGGRGNITFNFTDDGDGYGGYAGYFDRGVVYDAYGDGGKYGPGGQYGDSGKIGAGGLNSSIIAAEKALLPGDVPSQDSLFNLFKDKWAAWMKEYYRKKALQKNESGTLTSEERNERHDPFWPQQLIGFGKGDSGDPLPPYAYKPNNDEGFPSLCFQPIQKGIYEGIKCDPGPRYAFEAGIKICVAFYFRGCGENQNNFKTKQSCEETCTKVPKAGCDPDTMQDLDRIAYEYSLV